MSLFDQDSKKTSPAPLVSKPVPDNSHTDYLLAAHSSLKKDVPSVKNIPDAAHANDTPAGETPPSDMLVDAAAMPKNATLFDELIIPLAEEQLVVGKRLVETATVRLTTHAEERTELVEIPVTQVHWQVEHMPIDRVVTETPSVRVEGDTTIYPVMEERLVIHRELVLREEVRVTRTSTTTLDRSTHTLRCETLTEERLSS